MSQPLPVALVTGANAGIGRATAARLAAGGYRVVCTGRRLDAVAAAAAEMGGEVLPLGLDVTDASAVGSLLERLPEGWHEIDVLVNNAGHDLGGRRLFHEMEPGHFRSVIETNVTGALLVTHTVLTGMVARDRGHIVNMGSMTGLYVYAKTAAYAASKYALHGFSEVLRTDYARTGIRVTEILPGLVESSFALNRWRDQERADRFYGGAGARLSPDDVAEAVLFALRQPPHVDVAQVVVQPVGRHAG